MTKTFLPVLVLLLTMPAAAQKKITSLVLSDTIIAAAVDRPGEFYLVTRSGQIQKFDHDGKLLIVFKHGTAPTLFDPRDGARLFAYYRPEQQYVYYNPSFEVTASYRIDPAFAIEPWLICPSGDHKLWVLDRADHTLKKLNARHTEVEVEAQIDSAYVRTASRFIMLRDYQGFLFALDPDTGIHVFNALGRHIRTIDAKGTHHFNFIGEELYFISGNTIQFFDIFTSGTRQRPLAYPGSIVLLTDERMLVVQHQTVSIFEFVP